MVGFDILMQYYSKLRDQMSAHDYSCLFADAGIITSEDKRFINSLISLKDSIAAELILTRLANHLLCGKVSLFCKMLEILQSQPGGINHLVAEIQVVLDQAMPTGMKYSYNECLCITYCAKGVHTVLRHTFYCHSIATTIPTYVYFSKG